MNFRQTNFETITTITSLVMMSNWESDLGVIMKHANTYGILVHPIPQVLDPFPLRTPKFKLEVGNFPLLIFLIWSSQWPVCRHLFMKINKIFSFYFFFRTTSMFCPNTWMKSPNTFWQKLISHTIC